MCVSLGRLHVPYYAHVPVACSLVLAHDVRVWLLLCLAAAGGREGKEGCVRPVGQPKCHLPLPPPLLGLKRDEATQSLLYSTLRTSHNHRLCLL